MSPGRGRGVRIQVTPRGRGFSVRVDGERARLRPGSTSRLVYRTRDVVVKVASKYRRYQNVKEADALRSPEIRAVAALERVVLPRLLAVGPDGSWIAVERLVLRRRRRPSRDAIWERVERFTHFAKRCDFDHGCWNWAMSHGRPAVYDLGV